MSSKAYERQRRFLLHRQKVALPNDLIEQVVTLHPTTSTSAALREALEEHVARKRAEAEAKKKASCD